MLVQSEQVGGSAQTAPAQAPDLLLYPCQLESEGGGEKGSKGLCAQKQSHFSSR